MFIRAIANNEIVHVAWGYDAKIPGCLGFAVYRVDQATGQETALPAWVGWEGDANLTHQERTTAEWPVQKYVWKDLVGTHGATYRYKIVPMVGTPDHLTPAPDAGLTQISNPVTIQAQHGDIDVVFNRGILSTQALAHSVPHDASGGWDGQRVQM